MQLVAGCMRDGAAPPARTDREAPPAATPFEEPPPTPAETPTHQPQATHSQILEGAYERVLLLAPGGPVVVDIRLTSGGRDLRELFNEAVDRVLAAADTDGDGRPTWDEWSANEAFLSGDLAGVGGADSFRPVDRWVEQYDENKDGRMQRAEARSWLGRDSGRSADALRVRSTRYYRPMPSVTSRVWRLLDSDSSGALSVDEARAAPERIIAFDADDDHVISQPELATLREQLDAMDASATPAAPETTRNAALHLGARFASDRLSYILGDLYSPRQGISAESFPGAPGLFSALNENGDQWIDGHELTALATIEPSIRLHVTFGVAGAEEASRATIELQEHSDQVSVLSEDSTDRLVLAAGGARLILSAHDLAPSPVGADRLQAALMVHDQLDALFVALDANADGLLGEREITSAPHSVLACDANQNGALTADELPYAFVVAILRGERGEQRDFYVPRRHPTAPGDAAKPAWFVHSDFNRDGDVSRREFLGPVERFSVLDADGNGYLSAREAEALGAE